MKITLTRDEFAACVYRCALNEDVVTGACKSRDCPFYEMCKKYHDENETYHTYDFLADNVEIVKTANFDWVFSDESR